MSDHLSSGLQLLVASALVAGFVAAGVAACSSPQSPDDDEPVEEQTDEVDGDHDHHGDHEGHDHDDGDHHDHSFDDPEQYAESWNDPARDEWQEPSAVVEAMEIEEGMTVADLGAGTGYFIPYLSEAVGDEGTVYAVDIEEPMLEFIEDKADDKGLDNVQTVVAEADDSGLEAGAVDRVLTVNTWHHIPDRDEYAAHLKGRLAEGGSVWNVDFHEDSPVGPPEEHRLASETVIDEFEAGGLDAEAHELRLERQYVVVGRTD